jgi:chromosome segregation ATPase
VRQQLNEVQAALAAQRAAAAGIQEALLAAQAKGQQGEIALGENVKRVAELTAALTAVAGERDQLRSVQEATAQQLAQAQATLAAERAATARDKEALLATQANPQPEGGA